MPPALKIVPTPDWNELVSLGRQKADELIADMRFQGNPLLLGNAVRKIVETGDYDGQAVGFCQRIAEELISGWRRPVD